MPVATRARSGASPLVAAWIAACSASPLTPSAMPSCARSAAATGAKVAPPAESQRAVSTVADSASRRATSPMRRDLPRPGEPRITASRAARFATASSKTARMRASSLSRPTNAVADAPAGRSSDTTR